MAGCWEQDAPHPVLFCGEMGALCGCSLRVLMQEVCRSSWCWRSPCYLLRKKPGSKAASARNALLCFPTHFPVLPFSYFCGYLCVSRILPPARGTSSGRLLGCTLVVPSPPRWVSVWGHRRDGFRARPCFSGVLHIPNLNLLSRAPRLE